jgi:hypothetical protein
MEKAHPLEGSRARARMRCDEDGLRHDAAVIKYQIMPSEFLRSSNLCFKQSLAKNSAN